jgi:hypothetical protein
LTIKKTTPPLHDEEDIVKSIPFEQRIGGGERVYVQYPAGNDKCGASRALARYRIFRAKVGVLPEHRETKLRGAIVLPIPKNGSDGRKWLPDLERCQVVKDGAYEAYRLTLHAIGIRHDSPLHAIVSSPELPRMQEAQSALAAAHAHASDLSSGGFEAVVLELAAYICEAEALIGENVRDEHKVEALRMAKDAKSGRDRRGRQNESATMTRLTAARNRLERRERNIQGMEPRLLLRMQALALMIQKAEAHMRAIFGYLKPIFDYEDGEVIERLHAGGRKNTIGRIVGHLRRCEEMDFYPFRRIAFRTGRDLSRTFSLLRSGSPEDLKEVRRILRNAWGSVRLQAVQRDLEQMLLALLFRSEHALPAGHADPIIRNLHAALERMRELLPFDAQFSHPVCYQVYDGLVAAQEIALGGFPWSEGQAREFHERMRAASRLI